MGKFFKTAEHCPELEIFADLDAVIDRHEHFKPITLYELAVDVIVVFGDDDKPALSRNGSHPDAFIKVNGPELRARGLGDVTVTIDGSRHQAKTTAQRQATLAHELYHIDIQTKLASTLNDEGNTVIQRVADQDDYGRPVVRLIPDDFTITGFRQVAEWYGPDSMEVVSHQAMTRLLEQALMPFMGGDDDGAGSVDHLDAVVSASRSAAGAGR